MLSITANMIPILLSSKLFNGILQLKSFFKVSNNSST
ncbi:hypothetical protein X975_01979, partial [Stegodyphus mimosarum]